MRATLGSMLNVVVGTLAIVAASARVANAQLICPFEKTCVDTAGHGCGPYRPDMEFPPDMCECSGTNFFYYICTGGYGADYEQCCFDCHAVPDYGRPCVPDVEPPCTTCGGAGAGGSSSPPPPSAEGRPVSLTTGAVFFTHTDAVVGELALTRTYNSARVTSGRYGALGPGWNASFEGRIRALNAFSVEVRGADGFAQYYVDHNQDSTFEAELPVTKESWVESIEGGAGGYRRVFRVGGFETYGVDGHMRSLSDSSGVETTFAYDGRGRCSSVSRLGRSLSLVYSDDSNRPSQAMGPGGAILATYSYDGDNELQTVEYPDGGGYRFGYSAPGRVAWVTDLEGNPEESHSYDASWRATTSEISDGRSKLTFAYAVNKTTVTDALGTVSEYEYENVRGVQRVTKATGPCSSCGSGGAGSGARLWTYDDIGNVTRYQNEIGDVWTYTHDADNDLLTETDPLGHTTSYTHYPDGRIHTRAGPDGSLSTYAYGPAGPLSVTEKVSASDSRTTSLTYTPQGKVETVTDSRGKVTHMTYTTEGDLETVTDPLGHSTLFGYDTFGRRTTTRDALEHTTTTEYDARGRVAALVQHDSTHTDFGYDRRGHRTSVTDPEGRMTRYVYDRYGSLEKVKDPAAGTATYGYDVMGQLTSLTDALGRTTRFVYEQRRLVRTIYPGYGEPSDIYTYDDAGRISTRTDRKGVTTLFEYDPLGRLLRKTYSDATPPVNYTYDADGAVGRLTTVANGTDTLRWTYDLVGQVLSEQSTRNSSVISYSYDPAGNRVSVSLDGQVHVTYTYDDAARLTQITRGAAAFGFAYDDVNRRTNLTYPNGVVTSYGYDALNRLTSLQALLGGSTTITSFGYTYDDAGNRLTKVTPEFTEVYAYDPLDRLTGVERTGGQSSTWRYGYDAVGNRSSSQVNDSVVTSVYNEKNQLLSASGGGPMLWRGSLNEPGNVSFTSALVNGKPARMRSGNVFEATLDMTLGTNAVSVEATDTSGNVTTKNYEVDVSGAGATYTYDPNGNLATKIEETDNWVYTWNAENQLTKVEKNGSEVARFAYDPMGRRVEKVAGGLTTTYAYDEGDILRETRGAATLKYVHGDDLDEPLAVDDGTALSYFHSDVLGSIVRVTNAAGAVTFTRQYDSWGNLQVGADQPGYSFTGREWDPETGLYYYRARYYDPKGGRFVSEDPIRFLGGANFYPYVSNAPQKWRDPFGLQKHYPLGGPNAQVQLSCPTETICPCDQEPKGNFGQFITCIVTGGNVPTVGSTAEGGTPQTGMMGAAYHRKKAQKPVVTPNAVAGRQGQDACLLGGMAGFSAVAKFCWDATTICVPKGQSKRGK
jgi:RHS repeat-associated protein